MKKISVIANALIIVICLVWACYFMLTPSYFGANLLDCLFILLGVLPCVGLSVASICQNVGREGSQWPVVMTVVALAALVVLSCWFISAL